MIGETSFLVVCFSLFLFNDKSVDGKKKLQLDLIFFIFNKTKTVITMTDHEI